MGDEYKKGWDDCAIECNRLMEELLINIAMERDSDGKLKFIPIDLALRIYKQLQCLEYKC